MQRSFWNFPRFIETFKYSKSLAAARCYAAVAPPSVENPDHVAKTTIRLRGYQNECIQSVLSYLEKGQKRLGISLATGSGKTVIFTQLIDRVKSPQKDASRTLILAHRRELVEQAARHCSNAYPSKSIEIEMGNLHATGTADITIASVRSITSSDRLTKFDPERFKLILVDEAHHIVASSYMNILRYFGIIDRKKLGHFPALVGVSATLSRFDGLRLSDAIDHIVYHKDYVDMIGENWLSNVIFTTVQSEADISKVEKGATGDFKPGDLSRAVNTDKTNEITVRAWMARANERKSTIVFCVDLEHVRGLTTMFRKHGVDARFVTGDTPRRVRSERLDAFKSQEYPVLINCGVFTEGTDIPNIDCVLLARPTKSRNLLVQMIGRGMRLHPGKANCHIIDMVASLKVGVVTTPTLFGLDPAEIIKEADITELKLLQERKEIEAQREPQAQDSLAKTGSYPAHNSASIAFTDYDSVYDLINDTSGERHIRSISPFSWVHIGQNRYVLSGVNGDYITIEGAASLNMRSTVTYTKMIPHEILDQKDLSKPFRKSLYMRPRKVAESESFIDAVHAADTFAMQVFVYRMIAHSRGWRVMPATGGQVKFLNKFRNQEDLLTEENMTKGKAADMITKIKFGARGQFSKLEAVKRRDDKAKEKITQVATMKQREQIKVGPMAN